MLKNHLKLLCLIGLVVDPHGHIRGMEGGVRERTVLFSKFYSHPIICWGEVGITYKVGQQPICQDDVATLVLFNQSCGELMFFCWEHCMVAIAPVKVVVGIGGPSSALGRQRDDLLQSGIEVGLQNRFDCWRIWGTWRPEAVCRPPPKKRTTEGISKL